ncbi:glycosyltransferase family 2 protein [Desulfobacterales bacterium HSG16]|nr:glycosyltransferase family 2 protein [Desulfobacterales bacterium HSG16]
MMYDLLRPYKPEVDFSVIISCYFEERSIDIFYTRLSNTLRSMGRSYEIIFINDGSTDKTFEKLKAIFDADPNVTAVVDFFKNAGQANAVTPGVLLARGKAMVFIDSDLQLDPEELPLLAEKYDEGYDIVSGYRKKRQDSLSRKLPSVIANIIMRKTSDSNIRDFGCTFKIYDGRLLRAFEFGPFKPWRPVPVIAHAQRIAEVPLNHHSRQFGQSGWTFKKLFMYNMENIVNLSEMPFQLLGATCLFIVSLFLIRIIIGIFFPFSILKQVTGGLLLNIIIVNLLSILSVLTIIGEFVIRNFIILQRKPAYIIREIYVKGLDHHIYD